MAIRGTIQDMKVYISIPQHKIPNPPKLLLPMNHIFAYVVISREPTLYKLAIV
jgi:hypothetical protein